MSEDGYRALLYYKPILGKHLIFIAICMFIMFLLANIFVFPDKALGIDKILSFVGISFLVGVISAIISSIPAGIYWLFKKSLLPGYYIYIWIIAGLISYFSIGGGLKPDSPIDSNSDVVSSDGESTLAIDSEYFIGATRNIFLESGKEIIDSEYFIGATRIKFLESGKEITDNQAISQILGYLDVSNKRRDPCKCDGLFAEVTLKDNIRVTIELTPHGWGFKEDQGNIRYLKDPGAFNKLYEKLWEQYGPTSNSGIGQMYLFITPPTSRTQHSPSPLITGEGRGG